MDMVKLFFIIIMKGYKIKIWPFLSQIELFKLLKRLGWPCCKVPDCHVIWKVEG